MTTSTERPDGGELNSEIVRLIDELRRDEGDSVTFISDNPDFNGQPNCAIVCNGDWTGYEDRRFAADTILDALSAAATERKLPTARQVIAESNGHHWVQRFNLVCCRDCGIVRRADDKNSPCKGIVTVELRSPTNESPAPQATKKTYIKPLRAIVEIDERYADQIRDLLKVPAPQPPVEGLRELEHLREWKSSVLNKCKHCDGWYDLSWGGDKDGWGFVHYFIDHLNTRALASPSLTAGAWQDISTAPKDGTHVLVCDQSDPSFPFSQRPPTVAHWFGPPDLPGLRSGGWYLSVSYNEQPRLQGLTHWQPLPPTPATEQPSEAPPSAPDVREACAVVCDEHAAWAESKITGDLASHIFSTISNTANDCAEMIRNPEKGFGVRIAISAQPAKGER